MSITSADESVFPCAERQRSRIDERRAFRRVPLLIGHGFWSQHPPAEYLAATGITASEFTDHAGNIDYGSALGLRPVYCCVSTRDEWDEFEGTIQSNRERYAVEHPDAPDPHGRLKSTRTWFLAQQRWGRATMGFGLYLFASPEAGCGGRG